MKSLNTKPAICECGDHAWKGISKGFAVLVDAAEISRLDKAHHAHVVRRHVYARGGDKTLLHREIAGGEESVDGL